MRRFESKANSYVASASVPIVSLSLINNLCASSEGKENESCLSKHQTPSILYFLQKSPASKHFLSGIKQTYIGVLCISTSPLSNSSKNAENSTLNRIHYH